MRPSPERSGQTRQYYADAARGEAGPTDRAARVARLESLGYSAAEVRRLPGEALLCLGCGNPVAIADLRPGEAVLDLGCGGGLDVFLAATRVGPGGRVVGVDASPEMVARARSSAARTRLNNVRFGEGSIEKLPFGAGAFDVVLSNCVINHCPDPGVVFREARRVLRPRGRLCVTDLVTAGGFPAEALNDRVWGEWLRGAANRADYLAALASAGFPKVTIVHEGAFAMSEQDPALQGHIISLAIRAEG